MSYSLQPYNSNNTGLVNQQINRPNFPVSNAMIGEDDLLGSIFSLANRLMGEILRSDPDIGGVAGLMGAGPSSPYGNVFGISAMNVTQISCGPDGRPHIVQTHNERRVGPGGVYQTKKALRDPNRGIDKMQIGYFAGNRGEIIERQLDPYTGQYRQEVRRQGMAPNESYSSNYGRIQSGPDMQRLPLMQPQQYQYYPQQQQQPSTPYSQQPKRVASYSQQPQLSNYSQKPQQALPAPSSYQYL